MDYMMNAAIFGRLLRIVMISNACRVKANSLPLSLASFSITIERYLQQCLDSLELQFSSAMQMLVQPWTVFPLLISSDIVNTNSTRAHLAGNAPFGKWVHDSDIPDSYFDSYFPARSGADQLAVNLQAACIQPDIGYFRQRFS